MKWSKQPKWVQAISWDHTQPGKISRHRSVEDARKDIETTVALNLGHGVRDDTENYSVEERP